MKQMKNELRFEFEVNKENKTIILKREFDANIDLVWKAWTTAELLDQWWGPEPCRAKTKSMDFREGGYWLYSMIIPAALTGAEEDQTHWGKQLFKKIVDKKMFSGIDQFCDEYGNTSPDAPFGRFENIFSEENNGRTLVTMISTHNNLEDLEAVIEMGFQEGITVSLNQLDHFLKND